MAMHKPAPPAAALARPVAVVQAAHHAPATAAEESPSLTRLVALAERFNPDLAAARAQAERARGLMIQAGLYPNPFVVWEGGELGHNKNQLGEQGPRVQQNFVTGGKLRLDQAAAAEGLAAAEWQVLSRWYDVLTRLRVAFFDALTAQREVETNEAVVKLAEESLDVANRLLKAGTGTRPDVIRATVELDQSRIRLGVARQRLTAARQLLAVAAGVPALADGTLQGSLEDPAPAFEWEAELRNVLARSSDLLDAHAQVAQAEQLVRRAQAQVKPDVQVSVRPFYSFPDDDMRLAVEAGFFLPLFNRNQGNIAAARAEWARTREQVRQVELRLTERLTTAFQRYQNARLQTDAYQKRILPNARESLRLVILGYEKGDPKYDYTGVLQAQQILVQAQLTYVQALGELWRAASEIAGLAQRDEL